MLKKARQSAIWRGSLDCFRALSRKSVRQCHRVAPKILQNLGLNLRKCRTTDGPLRRKKHILAVQTANENFDHNAIGGMARVLKRWDAVSRGLQVEQRSPNDRSGRCKLFEYLER